MAYNGTSGEALLVLENNDGKFSTNFRKMGQILQQPQYANKEAVIISIVGITRQGKSFFMNLLLMFLSGVVADMSQLFNYQGGVEAVTKGIYMWSQPFIRKLPSGKEVVVLIMDSQGTFDNKTTEKGNSNIFGLSTIMSSVQIFNVMDNIAEDYLRHLTLFSQFATMACKASQEDKKTFQKLIFLVRDWIHDKDYGFEGGEKLLDKVFKLDGRPAELQKVRQTLKDTYEDIHAFLLPDPGEVVKEGRFTGDVNDVSLQFLAQLKIFFTELVSERFLIPKRISGRVIKCSDVQDAFTTYFLALNENASPTNLVTATANIKFAIARNDREKDFAAFTDKILSEEHPRKDLELETELVGYRNELCQSFPLGTDRCSSKARTEQNAKLRDFLAERMKIVLKLNKEKQQKDVAHSQNSKLVDDKQHIEQLLNNERNREKELDEEMRRQQTEMEVQTVSMTHQIQNAQHEANKERELMMMRMQMEQERQKANLQSLNGRVEQEIEKGKQLKASDLRQQEMYGQQMMNMKAENEKAIERQRERQEAQALEVAERNRREIQMKEQQLYRMQEEMNKKREMLAEQDEDKRKEIETIEEQRRELQRELDAQREMEKDRIHQQQVAQLTKKDGDCTIS